MKVFLGNNFIHTISPGPTRVTPMALYTGTDEKMGNMVALNVLGGYSF
nr:MAG TPA: hypothetical protein [Caudoviricetes sp.]